MPLVSIIIPVYNTEKYLKKCLDSVVYQTYQNLEIIIINDASTDNSKEIIKAYAQNFNKIKVINKKENEGLSEARNLGMTLAQGDYLFYLDSDDWISKEAIQKLVMLALEYETKLVSCSFTNVIGNIQLKRKPVTSNISFIDIEKEKNFLFLLCNKLYDHNVFGNLRFPKGLYYEDSAFIYPLMTKIKRYVSTNEILYYYQRHVGSITLSTKINPNDKIFDRFIIGDCIKENSIDLGTYEDYKE